jgi:hypothetical protein
MITISFYPESDDPKLVKEAIVYKDIWTSEGVLIIDALEAQSGFTFTEFHINALVNNSYNRPYPLQLLAKTESDDKKGILLHQLTHRLLEGNGIYVVYKDKYQEVLEEHKIIYFILYDVMLKLYGEDFTQYRIETESFKVRSYAEAWEYVTSYDEKHREEKLKQMIKLHSHKK